MDAEKMECVGRSDSGDGYNVQGVAAYVKDADACIIDISHCSCYGTFDGGSSERWSGTKAELLDMAARLADPDMPDRTIQESDFDYAFLRTMYAEVVQNVK